MIRIPAVHYLTGGQIMTLYLRYKKEDVKALNTKKDFLEYIKIQVTSYGSLSPKDNNLNRKNLKNTDVLKLIKWGLI